jgi:hypothetical protein
MDDDGIFSVDVEDADLERCPVGGWSDEHYQVVVQKHSSHGVTHRVPYVRVSDAVLAPWVANPHLDNIACLNACRGSAADTPSG